MFWIASKVNISTELRESWHGFESSSLSWLKSSMYTPILFLKKSLTMAKTFDWNVSHCRGGVISGSKCDIFAELTVARQANIKISRPIMFLVNSTGFEQHLLLNEMVLAAKLIANF
jgi:hypothetical protein